MTKLASGISFGDLVQWITVLGTIIGFVIGWFTFKARTVQNRAEWSAVLLKDFLLHERNISVRRNLELFYKECLNNYLQSILSGDNPLLFCTSKEIDAARELEDFLAQLELFCYLEKKKTISSEDLEAGLGFWLSFFKEPRFVALRAYLEMSSFEYLTTRLGGAMPLNRILVYGTLKSGTGKHKDFGLSEYTKSLGTREIAGEIFAVNSEYPGAIVNLEVPFANFEVKKFGTFQCELLEVIEEKVSLKVLLKKLDEYENEGEEQEYRRFLVPIDDGAAWIYNFIQPTDIHKKIESGVWDHRLYSKDF